MEPSVLMPLPALLKTRDRVVLISGASRGIGRAVAEKLAAQGYRVSLGLRDPKAFKPLKTKLPASRLLTHPYDARAAGSAESWVAATAKRFGRIDAVVANAGISYRFSIETGDEAELDAMWETNAKGPMRLFRAAWPYLKKSGTGRAVAVASLSAKRVKSADFAGYAMSKYALLALTHSLRFAGWDYGIRSSAICPGYVATDMTAHVKLDRARMIRPETVAEIVALALSLPNNASSVEIPVNALLEHSY
jgi:NAD(P)-dependent dehydrogenase (short-subunit alcohol dehydrogenase family)